MRGQISKNFFSHLALVLYGKNIQVNEVIKYMRIIRKGSD